MIGAEKIIGTGNPFVQIFLNDPGGDYSSLHDAAQAVVSGAHVERFFAEHVRHGAAEGRKGRKLKHLQLEFAATIDKVGVGEDVHPLIALPMEWARPSLLSEGA